MIDSLMRARGLTRGPVVRAVPVAMRGRLLLTAALLLGLLVASRGITREGSFFLPADAPRYMMNGLFLYDLLASGTPWRTDEIVTYAERYYARYPALSLGHHPPLAPLTLVPFYAVFGVSVLSARLAMLTSLAIAVFLLYRLTTRIYDEQVAGWACVLFVTSPIIGAFGQRVMSEMPTLVLILLALTFIERFRTGGRLRDYFLFIVSVAASLLCRPTAIYMLPAYVVLLLRDGGWSRLTRGRVGVATALGAGVLLAWVVALLTLSPFNASVALAVLGRGVESRAVQAIWTTLMREWPLFLAAVAGCVASLLRGDRRVLLAIAWMASVLGSALFVTGWIEPDRYTILAVPAYCIAGASLAAWSRATYQLVLGAVLLVLASGTELRDSLAKPTWDAPGYEAAAQFVLGQEPGPTVLYSASVDPGYFVFFVRKHDPAQRLVVLRSDKLLTTSLMGNVSIEDRISAPGEIYAILRRFGTRFVVLEDRASESMPLEWLRTAVKTDQFIERQRFPIDQGSPLLRGVALIVYEYRGAVPPHPAAELDLNLPLVGRRVRVPLSELTHPQR